MCRSSGGGPPLQGDETVPGCNKQETPPQKDEDGLSNTKNEHPGPPRGGQHIVQRKRGVKTTEGGKETRPEKGHNFN